MLGITARTVVNKVISGMAAAGITVVTARGLGPDGRGAFVLLTTVAMVTYLASTFGVNTAARVHLVAQPRLVELTDYLGLSAALVAGQTVGCALLGAVLMPLVGIDLAVRNTILLGLLGGTLLAQYMLFDALNAYGRTARASALDAAGSTAQFVLVLGLAQIDVKDVGAYIAALSLGNLLQIALELLSLRSMQVGLRPRYRRREWRLLLRSGLPGTALSLAQMLTFRLDRYLVGIFLTPAAVGVYSVAAAIPELLRTPSFALSYSFFYRIASGAAEPEDFRTLRRWFVVLSVVSSAATFALAPFIVRIAFGDSYLDAVGPLRVLLLAEAGVTIFYLDAFSLAALNRIAQAAAAAATGLAVVALGDVLLVPPFGIAGAAWASALGFSTMGFAAAFLLRRQMRPSSVTG